jgi:hypothetical protein
MGKTMCEMDKGQRRKKQEKGINYKCKRCGEQAHKEKNLCKPVCIKENEG